MLKPRAAFLLLLLVLSFQLRSASAQEAPKPAQGPKAAEATGLRINHLINSSMETVRARAAMFNDEVVEVNKLSPLSLENLDSNIVAVNSGKVLAFTQFLTGFLKAGDSIGRGLEDSLFILKNESQDIANDRIVKGFESSYTSDRSAFDKYVTTLRTLYEHVLTALLFLQQTPYHIHKKQLEFVKKEDLEQYQKLMKSIEATSVELNKASQASRKATALANKTISELNKAPKTKKLKK